jgi:hypothetical protein
MASYHVALDGPLRARRKIRPQLVFLAQQQLLSIVRVRSAADVRTHRTTCSHWSSSPTTSIATDGFNGSSFSASYSDLASTPLGGETIQFTLQDDQASDSQSRITAV